MALTRLPLPLPSRRVGRGEARDSAASSLTGGGVAGSSLSQESLVIADPFMVAPSSSPARGRRSQSRGRGNSTRDRSSLCSSRLSPPPPLGVGILERSIVMPALGPEVTVTCRAPAPRTVRGLVDGSALAVSRPAPILPVCGLVAPDRGLRTATGIAECTHALGVTVRGLDACARDLLAVAKPGVTARGHTGPTTGHVTIAGLVTAPLLLTVRGLGRGVGGLDGVPGIARKLLLLPAIAVTLG